MLELPKKVASPVEVPTTTVAPAEAPPASNTFTLTFVTCAPGGRVATVVVAVAPTISILAD